MMALRDDVVVFALKLAVMVSASVSVPLLGSILSQTALGVTAAVQDMLPVPGLVLATYNGVVPASAATGELDGVTDSTGRGTEKIVPHPLLLQALISVPP